MAESNLTVDADKQLQEFARVMETIMLELARKAERDTTLTAESKLMKKLVKHLKHGGAAAWQFVPSAYAERMRRSLQQAGIPYAATPNSDGDFMFIVKDSDAKRFQKIQEQEYMFSTEYAKELTVPNILELYKTRKAKKITTLSIKDPMMAEIDKQKLFQAGITFAEQVEKDGSTRLYLAPGNKFNSDGKDLGRFELMHAFEQSKGDFFKGVLLEQRFKEAQYDKEVVESFVGMIQSGRECRLVSTTERSSSYIDATRTGVYFMSLDKDGVWQKKQLEIASGASSEEIRSVLSRLTEGIYDMAITQGDEERGIVGERPALPLYDLPKHRAKREVEDVLAEVNAIATKRACAKLGEFASEQALYEEKRAQIIAILRKEEPPVSVLINDHPRGTISADEYREWFSKIADHYENQREETEYSCDVEERLVREVRQKTEASERTEAPEPNPERDE